MKRKTIPLPFLRNHRNSKIIKKRRILWISTPWRGMLFLIINKNHLQLCKLSLASVSLISSFACYFRSKRWVDIHSMAIYYARKIVKLSHNHRRLNFIIADFYLGLVDCQTTGAVGVVKKKKSNWEIIYTEMNNKANTSSYIDKKKALYIKIRML